MKVLISYNSVTGNTEAIAKSMAEGIEEHEVSLLPADKVDPSSLKHYDLIFLGTGTYASNVGKSLKSLMKEATDLSSKVVLFCTHGSPDPSPYKKVLGKLQKQVTKIESEVCAEFQCIGEIRKPQVVELLLKTDPTSKNWIEAGKGHPDSNDLNEAKEFARSVIQNL